MKVYTLPVELGGGWMNRFYNLVGLETVRKSGNVTASGLAVLVSELGGAQAPSVSKYRTADGLEFGAAEYVLTYQPTNDELNQREADSDWWKKDDERLLLVREYTGRWEDKRGRD